MRQCELISLIEQTAPLHLAAPWDHSGIQVAAVREDITLLAVCLDPTPSAIQAALDADASMVLAHHPLSLQARFLDRLDAYHQVASLLLGAGVPLYSAHTSLDVNPAGPVGWLGRELDLRAVRVLEPVTTDGAFGFGLCGDLPRPLRPEELLARLAPWAGSGQGTLAGPEAPATISRLAICPGSGGSMLACAADLGADLMITGDIKYHTALDSPVAALDVGHFMLEEEMMRRFAAELAAAISVRFIPGRDPLRPAVFSTSRGSGSPVRQEDAE